VIKATAADGLIRDELVHFLSASGERCVPAKSLDRLAG
jgi:hypothetical protein